LEKCIDSFKGKGGVVLFLYSVVLTRGVQQIKVDLAKDGSQPPLVVGPNWLCTSDLVSLMLVGEAKGNVSAYSPVDASKIKFPKTVGGVGLLSYAEIEAGVPIADELKFPESPVFILHGGDHFTILFADKFPTDAGSEFACYHWNGLPPAGPRMCALTIKATMGSVRPAPEKHKETFYKTEPGEIDDVVQAHPDDKLARPKQWTTWRFEVVLAVEDPDVQGVPRPPDVPAQPKFSLSDFTQSDMTMPWRCASCYSTRFKTMCFGQNANGEKCRFCGKKREEAGWSFYLAYDKLPPKMQRLVNRRHAPKIITLMHSKWPNAQISWGDNQEDAPSV